MHACMDLHDTYNQSLKASFKVKSHVLQKAQQSWHINGIERFLQVETFSQRMQ